MTVATYCHMLSKQLPQAGHSNHTHKKMNSTQFTPIFDWMSPLVAPVCPTPQANGYSSFEQDLPQPAPPEVQSWPSPPSAPYGFDATTQR
ncbi:hypothetical protein HZ326_28327 [Fusarium oxysporum f. sp. albedinis]|nr:hypothetical protein HZ326_28327 [Fusarium oxysporum f. sp. albedinis]